MRTITLTQRELHTACEHEEGILLRLASGQQMIGTATSSPYGKVGEHLIVQERLWVSTDGQYYAQDAPGKGVGTHYDVISQDGQQRWFSGRYTPTGFDDTDPRYLYPEFTHMVNSWSNRGYSLHGCYIPAFDLGFGEYDTTQSIRPGTGNTQRVSRSAEFRRRLRGNQMPEWAERLHIELTDITILPFREVVQSLGDEWKTMFWAFQDHYGNACIDKNPLVWQLSYHRISLKDFL